MIQSLDEATLLFQGNRSVPLLLPVAYPQKAGKAGYAFGGESKIFIGDLLADRRWLSPFPVAEPSADAESDAIRSLHQQRAQHALVFSLSGNMPDYLRFRIQVGLYL